MPTPAAAEAVMPAVNLPQGSANQRREERAQVDAHVKDGEGAVAARIARRIKAADLGGDVGLEAAVAQDEEQQRDQEHRLDGHQEMADGHQHSADDHGLALPQQRGRPAFRRKTA